MSRGLHSCPFFSQAVAPSTCLLLEAPHFLVARGRLCETAWQLAVERAPQYCCPVTGPVGHTVALSLPLFLHDQNPYTYKSYGVMQQMYNFEETHKQTHAHSTDVRAYFEL